MNLNDRQINYLRGLGYTERNPMKKGLYAKTDKHGNNIYIDCRDSEIKVYAFDNSEIKVYAFDNSDGSYDPPDKARIIQQIKALNKKQMKILGGVFNK